MKLSELEEGKVYKCKLSDNEMLVVSTKKDMGDEKDDREVLAGKYVIEQQGIKSFAFDELYDGQLEELTNNKRLL